MSGSHASLDFPTFLCLGVVREIDRSPLANSMHIRVTGRYTVDWSGQGIGSYFRPCGAMSHETRCPVFRMDSPLVLCRVVRLHTSTLSVGLVATSCGLLYALGQQ